MAENREERVILIRVDASAAVDGSQAATRALERLERSQGAANASLSKLEASLGRVGGFLKANLALYAAELGAKLVEMGKGAFEAASGLGELAEQLGTNARALQGLQFQAAQYGVKQEQLETGLSKFSQKMGEAAGGSKEMLTALEAVGVKILDFEGKLRPTEELMQDVAAAIVAIDDPARKTAAAVDFFGKAGARLLPMLNEMAKGADNMSAAAERSGAMITDKAIARLDELADRAAKRNLRFRAELANALSDVADLFDKINEWAAKASNENESWFKQKAGGLDQWAANFSEALAVGAAKGAAMFLEAFRALPDQLGKLFTDAFNNALAAVETGLNKISDGLASSWLGKTLGIGGGSVSLGRMSGGGASWGDYTGQIAAAGNAAAENTRSRLGADRAAADRAAALARQAGMQDDEAAARVGKLGPMGGRGVRNPPPTGAGQSEADAIAKAMREARRDVEAQTAFADASEKGAQAVANLETHFKALKAAQDAYGKTADQNTEGVKSLTAELEKLFKTADKAKSLKEFNLSTVELEKANELLAAENRLINDTAETRARELALIKSRQEVEAKGLDASNEKEREAIERRTNAITQNERLKAQGDEIKKANELWTAPLKRALESIQTSAADMWYGILENGKFSMEEFGQLFARTAKRAAAELLALATIRPVINFAVDGLSSLGLVSPATAASLGYGSTLSSGAGSFASGAGASAGSLGGMGGGGLGGLFSSATGSLGSFGTWLNTPFIGGYSGVQPVANGVYGPAPNIGSGGGGLTPMGALAGVASMGMGAYSLATSKTTGGKIGGAAGMLGGAMSMVGALVPALSALGPIGMGVGLVASILPSLLGGGEPERPPQPPLNYGAGIVFPSGRRFTYGGDSLNAGQPMTEAARGIGGRVDSLFSRAGLTVVPGQLIGGDIASGVNNTWGNGGWQGQAYTQIGLHTPTGYERITYNDPSRTIEQATDLLIASIFKSNVLRGGVSGVSESLKTAVKTANPATEKGVSDLVDFVSAYDNLGKAINTAKDALTKIDDKFADLANSAADYGLAIGPITDEQVKARKRYAQDYIDTMVDPLQVDLRALQDQRDSALASAEYIRENIKDVYVDINKITEYYLKKEADLKKKYADESYGDLQKVIDKLTFGTLANASPTLQYSGQRATYMATLAQARAGSTDATNRLADVADSYATVARNYFGSSAEYAALVEQIRKDLIDQQTTALGPESGTNQKALNSLIQAVQLQTQATEAAQKDSADLREQVAALVAQLARR